MAQSSLAEQMVTALQTYGEPAAAADPRPRLWFQKHARLFNDGTATPPGYPMFFNTYFVNNLLPTEVDVNTIKGNPIWFDVDSVPLHIKGTYTINGDTLNAEVGLLAAPSPEAYMKLGELKGNPAKGPVTVTFDNNPAFYNGSVSLRVRKDEELAGGQTLGIFTGIVGSIDWKGLGVVIAKRDIRVVEAI